jgi:phosphoglycolate phosphatase-like HAD superfamily hydrolase
MRDIAWVAICALHSSRSAWRLQGWADDTLKYREHNYAEPAWNHDMSCAVLPRLLRPRFDAGAVKETFHVGDTPFDVLAAKQAGAVPIGVCTGIFTQAQLAEAVPETVHVSSFADLNAALALFGVT